MLETPSGGTESIHVINPLHADPYQPRIERIYDDPPEMWQDIIGPELWFQFGIYDARATQPEPLDDVGRRHLARQLELAADSLGPVRDVRNILEIGFGWGISLVHLARSFPACMRLDGINISRPQAECASRRMHDHGLSDRVRLYLGSALDADLLPHVPEGYDLVLARGVITHFSPAVTQAVLGTLASRMHPGATVVISENLYNVPLQEYTSAIPDEEDRLACGHRKTPQGLTEIMESSGLAVRDVRKLPSNEESIRWLAHIRGNIDRHFGPRPPAVMRELRKHAENWSIALRKDHVSVYSIIAQRGEA
ncbi:class I SAM-dependent methyltransferase [Streptomyces sp. ODS28]|uniref:SAM-dependent methyltransferase n=1 Tax=Streptomyces sp. ODS28 TaxID=3136688 RepID=UPI0031E8A934